MENQTDNLAVKLLVQKGMEILESPYQPLNFTKDPAIDKYLNDLENYPHFFVLACVMDRQMPAERAWKIPFFIAQEIDDFNFKGFSKMSLNEIQQIFFNKSFHRFNKIMAGYFYKAVQKIEKDYKGDASQIWKDNMSCGIIFERFLQFEGVGIKIASMATNCLLREFKLPLKDKSWIDISPDVHIRRVFKRLGFVQNNSSVEEVIFAARKLNPSYPGVFDLPSWEIARKWCHPNNPECQNCYITEYCKKN